MLSSLATLSHVVSMLLLTGCNRSAGVCTACTQCLCPAAHTCRPRPAPWQVRASGTGVGRPGGCGAQHWRRAAAAAVPPAPWPLLGCMAETLAQAPAHWPGCEWELGLKHARCKKSWAVASHTFSCCGWLRRLQRGASSSGCGTGAHKFAPRGFDGGPRQHSHFMPRRSSYPARHAALQSRTSAAALAFVPCSPG